MLSKRKLEEYLISMADDTNRELDRFIQDLLIKIEFGHFEPEDEEEYTEEF